MGKGYIPNLMIRRHCYQQNGIMYASFQQALFEHKSTYSMRGKGHKNRVIEVSTVKKLDTD